MQSGHTVLIVDDEQAVLDALRLVLEKEGVNVETAKSGREGLDLIRSSTMFSMIFSDQRMEGMDGVEFLEQARVLSPATRRVLLTGYSDQEVLIEGINRGGIHRFITKPWKNEDLRSYLRQGIKEYEQAMENRRLGVLGRWYHALICHWSGAENDTVS